MKKEIVRIEHLSVYSNGKHMLDDFHLNVYAGEVVNLIGLSGSGMSVLLSVLNGLDTFASGRICINGDVFENPCVRYAHPAIFGISLQSKLVPQLSVAENLFVIRKRQHHCICIPRTEMYQQTNMLLSQYLPEVSASDKVSALSFADCIIIEVLKAIVEGAELLLIDDVLQSLSLKEKARFVLVLRFLRREHKAVLYTSHKTDLLSQCADRIVVIRKGRHVRTVYAADFDSSVIEQLELGTENHSGHSRSVALQGVEILRFDQVRSPGCIGNVSFSIHKGEIVGLYDIENRSNKELTLLVSAAIPMRCGRIFLDGVPFIPQSLAGTVNAGIGIIREEDSDSALIQNMNFVDNLFLPVMKKTAQSRVCIDAKVGQYIAKEFGKKIGIDAKDYATPVMYLDEHVKQRILLYRWILCRPKVLVCIEPYAHADILTQRMMYTVFSQLAENGTAVLISSADVNELSAICNRVLVFSEGRLTGERST